MAFDASFARQYHCFGPETGGKRLQSLPLHAFPSSLKAPIGLFSRFCTSRHLTDFVGRFSDVRARLCYCADYGYFEQPEARAALAPYVTFISPCPAKGLSILLRLALMRLDGGCTSKALKSMGKTGGKPWMA